MLSLSQWSRQKCTYLSISIFSIKIWSLVLMPFLKPFCSGQIILLFSKYSSSLLNIILVNNLLKQLEMAIPL